MAEDTPTSRLVLIGLAVLALGHSTRYLPHFSDDGFISLRYAQRLADGHGLTWNAGVWVEGYSNLLWVLGIAGLDLGGVGAVDAARALGCLGLVLAVTAVHRISPAHTLWVALSGGLASWAVGGLEHTLFAGLAAWSAVWLQEERTGTGRSSMLLAPLLVLLRVDGIVLALGLAAGAGRKGVRFAGVAVVAAIAQVCFRLWAYGAWLPNTAAKVAFTPGRFLTGARWVFEALAWHAPLVVLALVAVRLGPAATGAATWLLYLVVVGGDAFNGFRMLVPIVPLLALLVASRPWPRWVLPVGLLAYLPQLFSDAVVAQTHPGWALQSATLGGALKRGFGDDPPLLATDAAGALPFSTGFETVDMLGLNDLFLAQHPPEDFGRGPLHHELGDGAYVASRSPDLVAFCSGLGVVEPCFRGGEELVKTPFWTRMQPVVIEEQGVIGRYWLSTERFGPIKSGDGLEVPALLLSGEEQPARAGRDGFYLDLAEGEAIKVRLDLPQGRWRPATQGFTGPTVLHLGGELVLRAKAGTARVVRSLTWIRDPSTAANLPPPAAATK